MERFWTGPVFDDSLASTPLNGFPPSIRVLLHTDFFMPSEDGTQGPPVSLQPGEPTIAHRPKLGGGLVA
jgi:hypothetical protein